MFCDQLGDGLMNAIPDARLNGHPTERLPNTVNISFKFVEGEAILLMLDKYGICASSADCD